MSNSMARNVENVHGAIAEVVVRLELAELGVGGEIDFDELAALKGCFEEGRVFPCWVAGQERLFEAGTDEDLHGLR